jgi:hypothetical protein
MQSAGPQSPRTNRNDAQPTPSLCAGFSVPLSECAESSWVVIAKSGDFPGELDGSGGLKNRYRLERKSWIPKMLTSRTLSVCGEVAERLKAAVC